MNEDITMKTMNTPSMAVFLPAQAIINITITIAITIAITIVTNHYYYFC